MKNRFIIIFSFLFSVLILSTCRSGSDRTDTTENGNSRITVCSPAITDKDWYLTDNKAPLFEGLKGIQFKISTNNPEVQKYFNQGLMLAYGFNHAEAARSFYYAIKLDSACAMCYWGFAYVLGPNYNAGMEPDNYERAYQAIQNALKYTLNITDQEKMLIEAMAGRYSPAPAEVLAKEGHTPGQDSAYAFAMKAAYTKYPNDADIGALYAESLMDLHPWDLWEKNAEPKPWTPQILQVLKQLIKIFPKHAGAHHLYIHAVEASQNPEAGLVSANALAGGLVPGAGHLVHMPSHIYIRTGDYHKGTESNIRAAEVDSNYVAACNAQGAYPLLYYPHVYHFMTATATLEGNSRLAMFAAQKVSRQSSLGIMKDSAWVTLQNFYCIPYFVAVKLGLWDEILEMENEYPDLAYVEAINHFARGMAYLGKKEIGKAGSESEKVTRLLSDPILKNQTIWGINTMFDIVSIADKILKGEILAMEGDYDESLGIISEAVKIEDQLKYAEPPDWIFSVRHYLGAIQIKSGRYRNAIETYRQDLIRFPRNGWALKGLEIVYQQLGDLETSKQFNEQFTEAWKYADVRISGSVFE